jgi:SAM-dependent methyltransferase
MTERSAEHATATIFELGSLADALTAEAFGEFVTCFNPFTPRRAEWTRHRDIATPRLQSLIDFLLLNRPVEQVKLPENICRMLPQLAELGLVTERGRRVILADGLVLLPVFGRWLLCQPPGPNASHYFGDDTVALLSRLTPRAGGRCLDLCAGPGMLGLHCAGIAEHVTAVEYTPRSAQLARLNVELNRLSARMDVVEGDLYEPVQGLRFDTIVANPPMLPYPDAFSPPNIGHGGNDGFRLTRRILSGLGTAMTPKGAAQIIGTCLSDGHTPIGLHQLQQACGRRLQLTVCAISHHFIGGSGPWFETLAATVALASGVEEAIVRREYEIMLERLSASHLCHIFLHAIHGAGDLDIMDFSHGQSASGWHVGR